jgi:transcriptional regulator with GAF, ATPase, and Fis domain
VLCERGHSIPLAAEKSLVARTARSQGIVLVDDTRVEPNFMPNPLLPRTRSEMAIPLAAGDKVLGVLDVQDDQPYRFTRTDQDTFSTLAGQIAIALQNASLFEQAERSLAETQARFEVSQALADAQTEDQVLDAMIQAADFYPQAHITILRLSIADCQVCPNRQRVLRPRSFRCSSSSHPISHLCRRIFPLTSAPTPSPAR